MRALIGPPARVLDGTAEATGLADASADAVTVAQAFHWFDGERALAEIHRVLRPGGVLALIWNRRRIEDEIHQRLTALFEPLRGEIPAHRTETWRAAFEGNPFFGPLREETFASEQVLDADALVDQAASISLVAVLEDAERAQLLDAVRALAADGPVTLRYAVQLHVTQRRPG